MCWKLKVNPFTRSRVNSRIGLPKQQLSSKGMRERNQVSAPIIVSSTFPVSPYSYIFTKHRIVTDGIICSNRLENHNQARSHLKELIGLLSNK